MSVFCGGEQLANGSLAPYERRRLLARACSLNISADGCRLFVTSLTDEVRGSAFLCSEAVTLLCLQRMISSLHDVPNRLRPDVLCGVRKCTSHLAFRGVGCGAK